MSSTTRTLALTLAVGLASASLISCKDNVVEPVVPRVVSLEVFPSPANVRVAEDLVMVARMVADSGADRAITWRSSDPRRVTVSQTGILTGVSVGPAVITIVSDANPNVSSVVTVTVSPRYTGIQSISAAPSSLVLTPGQTQGVSVTVGADPGISRAVTFTSDSPDIATVSTSGVVTGVAVGSARITARSIADTSASTTVPVTVRAPSPARVSIQSITSRGTGIPVDLQNVNGQIDVIVNIEPGESALSRVDLVISNNGRDTVVASQQFSAAQYQALAARIAEREETPSAIAARAHVTAQTAASQAMIVQSFRSDAFNSATGVVAFRNSPITIKVIAVDASTTGNTLQSAFSTVTAQLNNLDGFLTEVRALATTGIASALDANGRRWLQAGRGLAFTTTPVLYSGRALGARTISFPGGAPVVSVNSTKSGVSVDTLLLPALYVTSTTGLGYVVGDLPAIAASDVSGNAIPLVLPVANGSGGGGGIMNVQPTFTVGTRLEGIRVDNAPPPAPTLVISSSRNNSNNWINGAYEFASGLSGLAPDQGVGLRGAQASPNVTSTGLTFQAVSGALTDTTEVTLGSQLPPSNTNSEYTVIASFADRLGNARVVPLTGAGVHPGSRFGVDLVPPTLRYASGSVAGKTLVSTNSDSVFTNALGTLGVLVFAVDAIDDRAGLQDGRVGLVITRYSQPTTSGTFRGTTTCVLGTLTTTGSGSAASTVCAPSFVSYQSVLPDEFRQVATNADNGTGLDGYFMFTGTAQDQAGNVSAPVTKQMLIDGGSGAAAPQMTGLGVSGVLNGGQPAAFIALATDNVELWQGGVMVEYPNLPSVSQMLAYGTPFSGAIPIGIAFDSLLTAPIAGTHPAFTVPSFIRGLEMVDGADAPKAYPTATAKPVSANAWVSDFAQGGAPSTLAANSRILAGSVQSAGTTPGFLAANGTPRELRLWRRSPNSSSVRFEAIGPSGQVVSPFARVMLARLESSLLSVNPTVWRVISELTTPIGSDNGLRRAWTYDFGFPPAGTYVAIGVSASGDAIITQLVVF